MSHYEGRREVPRRQTHEGGGSAAPRRESSRRPRMYERHVHVMRSCPSS